MATGAQKKAKDTANSGDTLQAEQARKRRPVAKPHTVTTTFTHYSESLLKL